MTSPELMFKSEKGREWLKELGVPEGYAYACAVALEYTDSKSPRTKPRNKEPWAQSRRCADHQRACPPGKDGGNSSRSPLSPRGRCILPEDW